MSNEGDSERTSFLFPLFAGILGATHAISGVILDKVVAATSAGFLTYPLSKWRIVDGFRSAISFLLGWAILAYVSGEEIAAYHKLDVAITLTATFASMYGIAHSFGREPKGDLGALKRAVPVLLPVLMVFLALMRVIHRGQVEEGYLASIGIDSVGMAAACYLVNKIPMKEGERAETIFLTLPTPGVVERLIEREDSKQALIEATIIIEAISRMKRGAPLGLDWQDLIEAEGERGDLRAIFEARDAAAYGRAEVDPELAARALLLAKDIAKRDFPALLNSSRDRAVVRVVSKHPSGGFHLWTPE